MKKNISAKKNRIWELDFFRGLAIILVVIDHAMYDFKFLFTSWATSESAVLRSLSSYGHWYLDSDLRFFWRPAFLFVFFATSGICTAFSKNNFIRGIRLGLVAIVVSIVTHYVEFFSGEEAFILFGVLHCLAVIILVYSVISISIRYISQGISKLAKKQYNEKVTNYIASFIYLALSVVFLIINNKYNVSLKDVNTSYATVQTDIKMLGMFFFVQNWWFADYFPIFPFISFFFFGAALSQLLYPKKQSLLPCIDGKWHKVFTVPGKHSLIVYLSGQFVTIVFFSLLGAILG